MYFIYKISSLIKRTGGWLPEVRDGGVGEMGELGF